MDCVVMITEGGSSYFLFWMCTSGVGTIGKKTNSNYTQNDDMGKPSKQTHRRETTEGGRRDSTEQQRCCCGVTESRRESDFRPARSKVQIALKMKTKRRTLALAETETRVGV